MPRKEKKRFTKQHGNTLYRIWTRIDLDLFVILVGDLEKKRHGFITLGPLINTGLWMVSAKRTLKSRLFWQQEEAMKEPKMDGLALDLYICSSFRSIKDFKAHYYRNHPFYKKQSVEGFMSKMEEAVTTFKRAAKENKTTGKIYHSLPDFEPILLTNDTNK